MAAGPFCPGPCGWPPGGPAVVLPAWGVRSHFWPPLQQQPAAVRLPARALLRHPLCSRREEGSWCWCLPSWPSCTGWCDRPCRGPLCRPHQSSRGRGLPPRSGPPQGAWRGRAAAAPLWRSSVSASWRRYSAPAAAWRRPLGSAPRSGACLSHPQPGGREPAEAGPWLMASRMLRAWLRRC